MATLFVSDLHLDPARPAVTALFLDFLERRARRAEALYILGDLFEAWIGDDDDAELGETVAAALRTLTHHGVPAYFLHGN
ncbi:MAG: UDP-2,3-diacylglucosamine diphosphatase, partial [Candidatus Competibacter sp.]|nr:UDP-2,3-diacylglucosamine diphosphatase [Candidatus Competibacter sp.]